MTKFADMLIENDFQIKIFFNIPYRHQAYKSFDKFDYAIERFIFSNIFTIALAENFPIYVYM